MSIEQAGIFRGSIMSWVAGFLLSRGVPGGGDPETGGTHRPGGGHGDCCDEPEDRGDLTYHMVVEPLEDGVAISRSPTAPVEEHRVRGQDDVCGHGGARPGKRR